MRYWIVVAFLVLSVPARSWACSCGLSGPPCEMALKTDAVFLGTVLSITEPPDPTTVPFRKRTVHIRVQETFRGIAAGQTDIEILTGLGGGDCGINFLPGTAYVVYAYRTPEGLETGICSRTRPIADAAEDMEYLRSIPKLPETGTIHVIAGPPLRESLPGAQATIDGEGLHAGSVTDGDGKARFDSLRPGTYTVSVVADGYITRERKVEVRAKGCAEALMPMMLGRRIQGRVLTSDGRPAAGVQIQVRVIERPVWDEAQSIKTDADGNYEFRYFVQSGGYHLGVNLDHPPTLENPYTRWFFPGTDNPRAAAPLYFADAPETKHYDLVLPRREEERIIQGTVIKPDGQPVAGALVSILDAQWLWRPAVAETRADDKGQFLLRALDGVRYRLHAVASITGIGPRPFASAFPTSAVPLDVMPGTEPFTVRLVITRRGNSVREDRQRGFNQR